MYIENFCQQIQYEGISLLCYSCVRIGHKPIECMKQSSSHQSRAMHANLTTSKSTLPSSSLPTIANVTTFHQTSKAPNITILSDSRSQTHSATIQNPIQNPTPNLQNNIHTQPPNPHDSAHGPWMMVHYPKLKNKYSIFYFSTSICFKYPS